MLNIIIKRLVKLIHFDSWENHKDFFLQMFHRTNKNETNIKLHIWFLFQLILWRYVIKSPWIYQNYFCCLLFLYFNIQYFIPWKKTITEKMQLELLRSSSGIFIRLSDCQLNKSKLKSTLCQNASDTSLVPFCCEADE